MTIAFLLLGYIVVVVPIAIFIGKLIKRGSGE
jgi:hypothetical protein